ncbi:MAG TPA: class I SAM-dependent methyltransferase [Candidatus Saccharimonadia bacterium]|nr:class I SAM-dependent methyltransferase [Candidatus Saccharimonadia bacterium]
MTFKDHFSGHAAAYAEARPTYPAALFEWLASLAPARSLAWDAGCGSGQAALALAAHFDAVLATDPSAAQVANAPQHPRVRYAVEPAEASSAAAGCVDLVSVAQAYHWFDAARFHAEVRRVTKPGAAVAVYGYDLMRISPAIDATVAALYDGVLGPYWPPERALVDAHYAGVAFPYEELPWPAFSMRHDWTLAQVLAYLATWSAVQRCRTATGADPLHATGAAIAREWGDPAATRTVEWPLFGRAGRVVAAS